MDESTVERWLPVVGYEGLYEVSDQGRVRSLDQRVPSGQGRTRLARGRILAIWTGDHYSKVRLKRGDGGKTWNIHVLVTAAFLGPRPYGTEVCHNNGRHHDNRLVNLRYGTKSENARDTIRHGRNVWLARTHCGKGHEYSVANTIVEGTRRRCRKCESLRAKRRWQAKKEDKWLTKESIGA